MESITKKLEGKGIYFIIVIIAVVLGVCFYMSSKAYEEPLKNYLNGTINADSKTLFKALPEYERRELLKDKTYAEYNKGLKTTVDEMKGKYGKNLKVSYKITGKEKINAESLKETIQDIKDEYEVDVKISEGYKLSVDVTIKGSDKEETDNLKYNVYKINNTWSIIR